MPEGRRTFGPVVVLGLASGTLAAVAGSKPMVRAEEDLADAVAAGALDRVGGDDLPLAGALALVTLAAWGVLLVTRGRVRRVVAVLAALAAAGVLTATAVGLATLGDSYREQLRETGLTTAADGVEIGWTGWAWVLLAAAVLATVAGGLAVRHAPAWPEMGGRYDAPAGRAHGAAPEQAPSREPDNLELWKQLDEGHDPTARPGE